MKLPKTIDELNDFERRQMNEDGLYNTILTVIYGLIVMFLIGMACSYVAQKLNSFHEQVQQSFIVS